MKRFIVIAMVIVCAFSAFATKIELGTGFCSTGHTDLEVAEGFANVPIFAVFHENFNGFNVEGSLSLPIESVYYSYDTVSFDYTDVPREVSFNGFVGYHDIGIAFGNYGVALMAKIGKDDVIGGQNVKYGGIVRIGTDKIASVKGFFDLSAREDNVACDLEGTLGVELGDSDTVIDYGVLMTLGQANGFRARVEMLGGYDITSKLVAYGITLGFQYTID